MLQITVPAGSIVDGVLPRNVVTALAAELVQRIGTQATPLSVTVELAASTEVIQP